MSILRKGKVALSNLRVKGPSIGIGNDIQADNIWNYNINELIQILLRVLNGNINLSLEVYFPLVLFLVVMYIMST